MYLWQTDAPSKVLSAEVKGLPWSLDSIVTPQEQQSTTVRAELVKKHPPGQLTNEATLPMSKPRNRCSPSPVWLHTIGGNAIRKAILWTNGSAGPSVLDATG